MGRSAASAALAAFALASLAPATADAAERRIELDRDRSFLAARTGRAGLLGFLGHDHGVLATRWSASLCVDPAQPTSIRGSIVLPVSALRIDTGAALRTVGLDRAVDPEQRQELQATMTGPRYLDADAHPEIRFTPTAARLDADGSGTLHGELRLRGVVRAVEVPVEVSGLEAGPAVVRGRFALLQSDYGMTPESIAGVVKVADAVEVRFRLEGAISDAPCPAPPRSAATPAPP